MILFLWGGDRQRRRVLFEITNRAIAKIPSLQERERGSGEERNNQLSEVGSVQFQMSESGVGRPITPDVPGHTSCCTRTQTPVSVHGRAAERLAGASCVCACVDAARTSWKLFPFDDLFSLICARQDIFLFIFLFSARHKAAHMIDNACVLGWLLALRFDLGLLAVREDDRM